MMRKLLKKWYGVGILVISLMLAAILLLGTAVPSSFNLKMADAAAAAGATERSLHEQTKIYSSGFSSDYYTGCEDYTDYQSLSPAITIFTPGLNGTAAHWSNAGGSEFAYNDSSAIAAITGKLNGKVDLYLAKGTTPSTEQSNEWFDFQLFKINDLNNYSVQKETDIITSAENHIVVIYQSALPSANNDFVYEEFHYIVDSISLQYKNLTGMLPRLNLVGHSRGGLINMNYASEHIYNVDALFSMGTPYNGSILGQIEPLLKLLGYANEDYEITNEGLKDILNDGKSKALRNKWNAALQPDADVNAVALGSMVSIGFIRAFVEDAATNDEYKDEIAPHIDTINTILNLVEDYPGLAMFALNFIGGLAEIVNIFGVNIYDELLSSINEKLEGTVSVAEISDVIGLFSSVNGEVVMADDLFVDTDSQLGWGFSDGIDYNGFKRYTHIFAQSEISENRSRPTLPAVAHNLETFNATYVSYIANSLQYGTGNQQIQLLTDMKDGTISPHESHTYLFVSQAGGERVISAENANISVYEFSDGALSCCMTGQESVEMDFYAGKTYYVIFEAFDNNTTLQYFFKIGTTIEAGSVTTVSLQKGLNVLCVQADASGYYNIKVPVSSISIESGAEKRDAYTYSIFIASGAPSIIVVNNTGEDLSNVSLEVQAPNEIELLEKITISSSNSVGTFKNPYSYSVTYQLIADSTQGDPTVNIVNKEMESIASVSIEDNRRVYTFTLAASESCYIDCVYNSQGTITLLLSVNQNQLKWKVDNAVYDSQKIILPRGHTYEIALLLYSQNHELGVLPNHFLIVEDNSQFTYHDGEITIRPTAQIGNNVVIRAHDYSEFTLQIVFAFDHDEFGFSVSNNEKIELTWSSPIGLKLIKFSVGTRAFSVSLNGGTSGKKDITSYIPAQMGTTPVSYEQNLRKPRRRFSVSPRCGRHEQVLRQFFLSQR